MTTAEYLTALNSIFELTLPSTIGKPVSHAVVEGVLECVSPMKPNKYYDGELTDGRKSIRIVGFGNVQQQKLQSFYSEQKSLCLRNCEVKVGKFSNELEVLLKS